MRKIDACIVCGSRHFEPLYRATFEGDWQAAVPYFLTNRKKAIHGPIAKCRGCGFAFTECQFDTEEYEKIYSAIPATIDEGKATADELRFERLLAFIRRYLPNGRFVDFGGADGQFVAQAATHQYEGAIYELRPLESVNSTGPIDTARFPAGETDKYDFLTAWDVMEHLPDLDGKMKLFHELVKDNGYLFFTIPDMGSFMSRLFRSKWNCVLLEHLWYFDRQTIKQFVNRFGFQLLHIENFPFSVDVETLMKRISQTFGFPSIPLPQVIRNRVITLSTGLIVGVFKKNAPGHGG